MYQLHFFDEIKDNELSDNEAHNMLAAIIRQSGSIIKSVNHIKIELNIDDYEKAFKIIKLIQQLYNFSPEIKTAVNDSINKEKQFLIIIPLNYSMKILEDLNVLSINNNEITEIIRGIPNFCKSSEDFSAFLSGIMISSGSIFIPQIINDENIEEESKDIGYRLEISPINEDLAKDIIERLKYFDIDLIYTVRKDNGVLYTTDSGMVSDVLALIKASKNVINLQNMIVERSIKNNSNRQRNCNIANIDKSIAAAEKIIEAIDKLKEKNVYNILNIKLREVGDLRYNNMDLSLEEIASTLNLTKSCVNHRLRKIIEIAESNFNPYMVKNKIPPHLTISLFETNTEVDLDKILKDIRINVSRKRIKINDVGKFEPMVIYFAPLWKY
jgi:DNA-binding protein WhiA